MECGTILDVVRLLAVRADADEDEDEDEDGYDDEDGARRN
jgi:hypothetical protein